MTQPLQAIKHPREALIMHIELQGITPSIWRRFAVPRNVTLGRLHDVIQIVMGWVDYHPHDFEIAGKRYSAPDPEDLAIIPETRLRLLKAMGAEGTFSYLYDFGDDWDHRIKLENIIPADAFTQTFYCSEGANACPSEDVGPRMAMRFSWPLWLTDVTLSIVSERSGMVGLSIQVHSTASR